jgi:hypothetical protein
MLFWKNKKDEKAVEHIKRRQQSPFGHSRKV